MSISKEEFLQKYDMCEILKEADFFIDLKYATKDNFLSRKLYKNTFCIIRRGTYNKLLKARDIFKTYGYYLKIWDAYRPIKVQQDMFNTMQDERYVTNPKRGTSNHCKGKAVDVTLCDKDGNNIKMPTEFDHFGIESSREYYNNLDNKAKDNVTLLEEVMTKAGFIPFKTEWWHFDDIDDYDTIYEEYE